MTANTRHIPLEGAYNIRDIGGYKTQNGRETKWKTFLRADSLGALTSEAQQQLINYGISTIIDLRHEHEVNREPNVFAQSDVVNYINISLFSSNAGNASTNMATDLTTVYKYILDHAQQQVLQVMQAMLEETAFPVLVHCTAGKDRTGVITALMLDLVDVENDKIAADYALTAQYIEPKLEKLRHDAAATGRNMSAFEHLLLCEPEAMLSTLRYLDNVYGGAADYLRNIGMSDAQILHLQSTLVV